MDNQHGADTVQIERIEVVIPEGVCMHHEIRAHGVPTRREVSFCVPHINGGSLANPCVAVRQDCIYDPTNPDRLVLELEPRITVNVTLETRDPDTLVRAFAGLNQARVRAEEVVRAIREGSFRARVVLDSNKAPLVQARPTCFPLMVEGVQ